MSTVFWNALKAAVENAGIPYKEVLLDAGMHALQVNAVFPMQIYYDEKPSLFVLMAPFPFTFSGAPAELFPLLNCYNSKIAEGCLFWDDEQKCVYYRNSMDVRGRYPSAAALECFLNNSINICTTVYGDLELLSENTIE